MSKYLWLAVTPDEYEFPIYMEDSSCKLAKILGINASTVMKAVKKNHNGKTSGRKIIKVEI